MPDLDDGQTTEVQGSGSQRYTLRNIGGVYSCSCPAWRNQSAGIERRSCKHLRAYRGSDSETERVGAAAGPVARPRAASASDDSDDDAGAVKPPPVLLAHVWENDTDLVGWWMSEKLDGVRAYWTGTEFLSRLGNRYHAPAWFTAALPDFPLDGELWGGRKKFQRTVSIVRRQDQSDHWKEIAYVIFDAPSLPKPFEDRLLACRELVDRTKPPYARVLDHAPCRDVPHLKEELARVEALGGEGLMLRKPGSAYEVGRSYTLLKVKSFFDSEARVVDYVAGAGRHKGRTGALVVEMQDGTRFSVGTGLSDRERESPPPVGSLITYRYQELSDGGVPRFPSYVGVRDDVAWPETNEVRKAARKPAQVAAPVAAPVKTVAAKPVAMPSTGAPGTTWRRFEFVEGTSAKFWAIRLHGDKLTVSFGRIGTSGQEQTKPFPDERAAWKAADQLIAEKVGKGYVEK